MCTRVCLTMSGSLFKNYLYTVINIVRLQTIFITMSLCPFRFICRLYPVTTGTSITATAQTNTPSITGKLPWIGSGKNPIVKRASRMLSRRLSNILKNLCDVPKRRYLFAVFFYLPLSPRIGIRLPRRTIWR